MRQYNHSVLGIDPDPLSPDNPIASMQASHAEQTSSPAGLDTPVKATGLMQALHAETFAKVRLTVPAHTG